MKKMKKMLVFVLEFIILIKIESLEFSGIEYFLLGVRRIILFVYSQP